MEYFPGSGELARKLNQPILTVGNFDGLHVGHCAIIDTVKDRARAIGGESVVYTFEPHPRKILTPSVAPKLLTTLQQKIELVELAGVDVMIVEPFDAAFARTSPEQFIRENLYQRIQPVEVYVGYDFHFGHDRKGSMLMLAELGPTLGFAVTILPEVRIGEGDVNSTRIRELLGEAGVEEAARMLGRPYAIRGRVVEGDRRGRKLGFPTANLESENELLPAPGVYAGRLRLLDAGAPAKGDEFATVTNIGSRPTFDGPSGIQAESHLIDFSGDLYGRHVELSFAAHLRPERRFSGVEALREQIASDVVEGRRILEAS